MKSTLAVSMLMIGALLFPSIHNITAVQAQTDENDSISFKTTLQPRAYTESMLDVPLKSNFSFGAASPLCPSNDCKQEVVNAFYSVSPDSPGLQGTLKIENKTTSTADIIKYSMIPFAGNFHVTGVEENRKTGHTILVFNGDFGLGGANTIYAAASPEFKYGVNGTLDNTTKVFAFEGQRTTS